MSELEPVTAAIREMYNAGLSRSNIYRVFNGDISERQIRKILSTYGNKRDHDSARREVRSELNKAGLNRKDYYLAQRNKYVGRGQRLAARHELLSKSEIEKFWEFAPKVEGS